jgi:hypothetical protein
MPYLASFARKTGADQAIRARNFNVNEAAWISD